MRRKYDLRNKKSFLVIAFLSIIVVCIFSLFIYRYNKASKIEYLIEAGTIIQDIDKNSVSVSASAKLKIRWNGKYYLVYQDQKIELGKEVIAYNSLTGAIKLYGTFYEIQSNGKIVVNKDETIVKNVNDTKFYKIDDREYLLIDKTITNTDRTIEANNYLLVELDKQGNAKLSNNKLQLKTISETTLVTSKYTFDIANEKLNYGKYDIDLKKIIGSSNQYVKKSENSSDTDKNGGNGKGNGQGTGGGDNQGNGQGTGGITVNNGTGGVGGNGSGVINNTDNGNNSSIDDIKNKTKTTSIIRTIASLSQIDVDYVIYDPYNEYKSVYAEIIKSGKAEIIHLSKNDTHMVISGLAPNTEYRISFVYTTVDKDGNVIPNTFEKVTIKTLMPKYSISVYKISNVTNKLTYKVNLQEGYNINTMNIELFFNYNVIDPETSLVTTKKTVLTDVLSVNNGDKFTFGTFDITGYDIVTGTLMDLNIKSVSNANMTLDINSGSTFRYGR